MLESRWRVSGSRRTCDLKIHADSPTFVREQTAISFGLSDICKLHCPNLERPCGRVLGD